MSYPLRSCHRCGKGFFSSYEEHICQDCLNALGWEPTPYTNADHIRYMTDEELAKTFDCRFKTCPPDVEEDRWCEEDDNCKQCWLVWLKQPHKEDT